MSADAGLLVQMVAQKFDPTVSEYGEYKAIYEIQRNEKTSINLCMFLAEISLKTMSLHCSLQLRFPTLFGL